MPDGEPTTVNISDIDLEYGALLRFKQDGKDRILQFVDCKDDLDFNFYFKGNTIKSSVYTPAQFKLKKYMAPPKKINYAKSVLSPMPGAIVNVSVEKG